MQSNWFKMNVPVYQLQELSDADFIFVLMILSYSYWLSFRQNGKDCDKINNKWVRIFESSYVFTYWMSSPVKVTTYVYIIYFVIPRHRTLPPVKLWIISSPNTAICLAVYHLLIKHCHLSWCLSSPHQTLP